MCRESNCSCDITRQELMDSDVFVGGSCPECSHKYGSHRAVTENFGQWREADIREPEQDEPVTVRYLHQFLSKLQDNDDERRFAHCFGQRHLARSPHPIRGCCCICGVFPAEKDPWAKEIRGMSCRECSVEICERCFAQAMVSRVRVESENVVYECPSCMKNFSVLVRDKRATK